MDYNVSYCVVSKDGIVSNVSKVITSRDTQRSKASLRRNLKRLIHEEYEKRGNTVLSIDSIEVHYFISINSIINDNVLDKYVTLVTSKKG